MIRIGHITCSAEASNQVGALYSELPQPPDYITIKGVYLNPNNLDQLSIMAIYQFDEKNSEEAIDYLDKRYHQFCEVEDTKFWFEDWVDTQSLLDKVSDGISATDVLKSISINI